MRTRVEELERILIRLLVDRRGASVIEFAILAPFVLIIVFLTFEMALDMMVDATVQLAAQEASRVGLLVQTPSNETRAQQAATIINNRLQPWVSLGATVSITEIDYGTYANVGTTNSQSGLGGLGDVVSYNIKLTLPLLGWTNILPGMGIGPISLQRTYLVQNEK